MESTRPEMSVVLKHRRRVFENSRFVIYSDHIAAQDVEVPDYLVVEPRARSADSITGVVVVPVREGGILLLNTYRHAVSRHVWELPRGFIEPGEAPARAALRELAEETGLACPENGLWPLGEFFPDPGVIRARVALFAAAGCAPGGGRLDDEIGIHGRVWHPEEAVRRMLRDGTLQEGATCVALYRYFAARDDEGFR